MLNGSYYPIVEIIWILRQPLSEYGKNFLKDKAEKSTEKTADLSQAKPVEIAEVRQLLPCIADSSKFRVIANIAPPLGGTLKVLEPLFPRGRYSDRIDALIIQKGEVITTVGLTQLNEKPIAWDLQLSKIQIWPHRLLHLILYFKCVSPKLFTALEKSPWLWLKTKAKPWNLS